MENLTEVRNSAEEREQLYRWFASCFAYEMTDEQLDFYNSEQGKQFLDYLSQLPELEKEAKAFQVAMEKILQRSERQLELAADFGTLFLTNQKIGAMPYASIYLMPDELLFGKPEQEMQALLKEFGVAVDENFKEPADHLKIELDLLVLMITQSLSRKNREEFDADLATQKAFIQEHLLTWLPAFVYECQQKDASAFYSSLAALLLAYMRQDVRAI